MHNEECISFLQSEYQVQESQFKQLICKPAQKLKDDGEIFVGKFIGIKDGFVLFKVRGGDKLPRISSYWTASYLLGEMAKFSNWGRLSWAELRDSYQGDYADVSCAWLHKMKDEPDFYMVAMRGFEEGLTKRLEKEKPIIAFGPKDPPLEYLISLQAVISNNSNAQREQLLNYTTANENSWHPKRITSDEDFTQLLKNTFTEHDTIAVQGPPGTGKTYRIAKFIASLLADQKSVLTTTLANEALKVLADSDALSPYLAQGRISKTSVSTDERNELPKLVNNKQNKCTPIKGSLSLSTFYIASSWAKDAQLIPPFDYVIVDEASQAYLPMLIASLALGAKVLWIGDQQQLAPIVQSDEQDVKKYGWLPIIKGFNTVCNNVKTPSFMLSDTYRLSARGAEFTSLFYSEPLRSVTKTPPPRISHPDINVNGGPSIVDLSLEIGNKTPQNAFEKIYSIVTQITKDQPSAAIAILAKFTATVQALQKYFAPLEGHTSNLKIETVDKIQGMTVDYTFFLIPNTLVRYSLENGLFNVATSRARYATVIVTDKNIIQGNMSQEVRRFFLKLFENKVITFSPKEISTSDIKVKVVGKIDLPKQSSLREVSLDDSNIFIIDTNVFIDCPDIMSRIGKKKCIVPTIVLEELDKNKLKSSINQNNLSFAVKNINEAFKTNRAQLEEAVPELLPNGFNGSNADSLILSIAIKYEKIGEKTMLLTSDNTLRAKAQGLNIETLSLKEFHKLRR